MILLMHPFVLLHLLGFSNMLTTIMHHLTTTMMMCTMTTKARVCLRTTLCHKASADPLSSQAWMSLSVKGKSRAQHVKGFPFLGRDPSNIWPRTSWWQSEHAISAVTNNPMPIALMHSVFLMSILPLILHPSIFLCGVGK